MTPDPLENIPPFSFDSDASPRPAVILLIDDNPESIRLLSGLIGDMGSVLFATSGREGLDQARRASPDLILLDVEMPGLDGYEVCRQLKQDAATRASSVIFVTSHHSSFHEVSALEAGAVDFLTKPLNPAVVRARVRTHLTLKRQTDTLARLAMHDGLTGIYNRAYLDEQLQLEWKRHQRSRMPLGFALMDIDHFKAYNDYYGHLQGDACLKAVAQALANSLRRPSEFVARYGGEEFGIVIPTIQDGELDQFGEWVCEQVRRLAIPHACSPVAPVVTISAGIAQWVPSPESSPEALVGLADQALYKAKQQGRNRSSLAAQSR